VAEIAFCCDIATPLAPGSRRREPISPRNTDAVRRLVKEGTGSTTLTLVGSYTASNFSATSDGRGATLITDPPITSGAVVTSSGTGSGSEGIAGAPNSGTTVVSGGYSVANFADPALRIAGAHSVVIQSSPAGLRTSSIRVSVTTPRSPTSTTRSSAPLVG
jgi:hypothetical protein